MSTPLPAEVIALNSRFTIQLVDAGGQAETIQYTLVTARQADIRTGLLDEQTPLGQALLGRHAGEEVAYPHGDLRLVRILAVQSGTDPISPEAAQKRRAAVHEAAAQSEITSQMIFATASGSKWGDYDVNIDQFHKAPEDPPAPDGPK